MGSIISSTYLWYAEEFFYLSSLLAMIHRGFVDSTFGMPFVGLVLTLSWSAMFSFYVDSAKIYRVDRARFLLELLILVQAIVYGPPVPASEASSDDARRRSTRRLALYVQLVAWVAIGAGIVGAMIDEEGRSWCHHQLFYAIELATSVSFAHMLLARGDSSGQSALVSWSRFAALGFGLLYNGEAVSRWCIVGAMLATGAHLAGLKLLEESPAAFYESRAVLLPGGGGGGGGAPYSSELLRNPGGFEDPSSTIGGGIGSLMMSTTFVGAATGGGDAGGDAYLPPAANANAPFVGGVSGGQHLLQG